MTDELTEAQRKVPGAGDRVGAGNPRGELPGWVAGDRDGGKDAHTGTGGSALGLSGEGGRTSPGMWSQGKGWT